MLLALGLLLLVAIALQWLTRKVVIPLWGPLKHTLERDESPVYFWTVLAAELGLSALCIYWFFT
jgi:hypothetical protein